MFRSRRSWAGLVGAVMGILAALYVSRSEAAPAEFRELRIGMLAEGAFPRDGARALLATVRELGICRGICRGD